MATFILSFAFGTVGFGYFVYGKKQQEALPMLVGAGLMIYPYFVPNPAASFLIGLALMALPWLFR